MYKGQKIVAVIPARGGSKGIPRKNMRLLNGKPLIFYSIDCALRSLADKVVVSSDDEEILETAKRYGAHVVKRPESMSEDEVTLDPVIFHATNELLATGEHFDIVITLQPTSPLIKSQTLDEAVKKLVDENYDTIISVKKENHIFWLKRNNDLVPFHTERKNRQYLEPIFVETGLIITKKQIMTEKNRIGNNIGLVTLSSDESTNIDTPNDWWIAENIMNRKRICIRVDGYREIGLGHVYRTLSLASKMNAHEIFFIMNKKHELGIGIVKSQNFPVIEFDGEPWQAIEAIRPDIVINDILDTELEYMSNFNRMGIFTVNFEDLGNGAKLSNVVINSMYKNIGNNNEPKFFYGINYECFKDDFYTLPEKKVKERVEKILITFGGVDENDIARRVLKILDAMPYVFEIEVILGLGYKGDFSVRTTKKCSIYRNVKSMAKHMFEADIIITAAGRTAIEAAVARTPCIVIAQNKREIKHVHTEEENGFINLGHFSKISDSDIANAVENALSFDKRTAMISLMKNLDLLSGYKKIKNIIFSGYNNYMRGLNA